MTQCSEKPQNHRFKFDINDARKLIDFGFVKTVGFGKHSYLYIELCIWKILTFTGSQMLLMALVEQIPRS